MPGTTGRMAPPPAPRLEWSLFALCLAVYAATRLVGITRFPAYFFCDEALQGNLASMLLDNGFRDHTGTLFPPYFLNDRRWAVSLSVYIHLLPVWLFGKSVACVRATSAAVTLLGAAAAGLALKEMKSRLWWMAPLIVGVTPLFFVHARLGFESAMMASFFFCFVWAYFVYRNRDPRWIFVAFFFGACTFYAYTAGQGVMLVTGLAFLLSDLRYHLRLKKRLWIGALLFAVVLAVPYARYRRLHPGVVHDQLAVLDSYWLHPVPLSAKLKEFGRNYAAGLDPRYWFRPNDREFARHRMDGMAFLPPYFVPFVVLGIYACGRRFLRSPLHRAVLLTPFGVPFSGAVANLQILRLLAMIVPVVLLTAVGLDQVYEWLSRWRRRWVIAAACAAALAIQCANLTRLALTRGPTWERDYGLYGLQWGAPQVFAAIREELVRSKDARVLVSSTWANNPAEFATFFLSSAERRRVVIGDIRAWDDRQTSLSGTEVFVMTPSEYELAKSKPKFELLPPLRTIPYPDGAPGFRFVRLRYAPNAAALFAEERTARAALREEIVTVRGESWSVRHSQTDMGSLPDLFDGRPETIMRGQEVNPLVFDVGFSRPRPLSGVTLVLGSMDRAHIRLLVTPDGGGEPRVGDLVITNRPPRASVFVPLPGGSVLSARARVEIADGNGVDPTFIEVGEMTFR
ncbi:MAG: hypothetical protein ABI592_05440 [Acidobacteriota bacterium]